MASQLFPLSKVIVFKENTLGYWVIIYRIIFFAEILMHYRHEINGLRAIAVIAIMLFHTQSVYYANAYIGVDLFFVISGYLITRVIINANDTKKFSIIDFYLKRARRLLPALIVLTLACIPIAWLWLFAVQFKDFSQSVIASNLFASNLLFWLEFQDYFSTGTVSKPLLHTWSLGVEAQFYLAYPLLLIVLLHLSKKLAVIGVLFFTGVLFGYTTFFIDNPLTFHYLPHSRFWLFGIGAMVLFSRQHWPLTESTYAGSLGCFGLVLIVVALLTPGEGILFWHALPTNSLPYVGVIGIGMVLLFADKLNIAGRFLAMRPLAAIGVISYSLYLWHYPIFVFMRLRFGSLSPVSYCALSAIAIVIAYLSWRYVEQPCRHKLRVSNRLFLIYGLFASMLIMSIGTYGIVKNGNVAGMTRDDLALNSNIGLAKNCGVTDRDAACQTSSQPEILVWGDSFAMHSVDIVSNLERPTSMVQYTLSACSPLISSNDQVGQSDRVQSCADLNESVLSRLSDSPSIKYVVISSRFSRVFNSYRYRHLNSQEKRKYYTTVRENLLRVLQTVRASNRIPVVISEPPRPPENKIYCAAHAVKFSGDIHHCEFSKSGLSESQAMSTQLLESVANENKVVWFDSYICPNDRCYTVIDGVPIYTTGGHLSKRGARLIGSKLEIHQQIRNTKY